ncbi:MAG: TolC family protein [Pseudomonadota bacterium]
MTPSPLPSIPILSISFLLSACTLTTVDENPALPPAAKTEYALDSEQQNSLRLVGVQDKDLSALINQVMASNLNLAEAKARLLQAEALADQSRATLFPTLSVSTNYIQNEVVDDIGQGAGAEAGNASFAFAPDFMGRRRAAARASRRDAFAAKGDFELTQLQLAHQVANAYYDAGEARENLRLLDIQIQSADNLSEIAAERFAQGATNASDVLQQRDLVASLKSQKPSFETLLYLAESRLDVLMAQTPDMLPRGPKTVPLVDSDISPGLPGSLIERRPDIVAARERLIAADYRVAEALAAYLPDFTLSASVNGPSFNVAGSIQSADTFILTMIADLSQTLYAGGARSAAKRGAKAAFDGASAAYARTWLEAVAAVSDNLLQEQYQQERTELLEARFTTASAALESAQANYAFGAADFTSVLTAQQSLLQAQSNLLAARRDVMLFRLNLLQALGAYPDGTVIPPLSSSQTGAT